MKNGLRKTFKAALTLVLILNLARLSYASTELKVLVNESLVDFPDAQPYINEDDRTLVPVRFIAENMDCEVTWNEEIRQVGIKRNDKEIKLNIGEPKAYVNEETITFDTKAIIKEDRTFVPLRFISEALGSTVEWDGESRTVTITYDEMERFSKILTVPKETYECRYNQYSTEIEWMYDNEKYIEQFGKEDLRQWIVNAKKVFDLEYNVDYRNIGEAYANEWKKYNEAGTWKKHNGESVKAYYALQGRLEDWKKYKLISKGIFVTNESLVYKAGNGDKRVRGRMYFKYYEPTDKALMENWEYKYEIGKWYFSDVEISFAMEIGQKAVGEWESDEYTLTGIYGIRAFSGYRTDALVEDYFEELGFGDKLLDEYINQL